MNLQLWLPQLLLIAAGAGLGHLLVGQRTAESEVQTRMKRHGILGRR